MIHIYNPFFIIFVVTGLTLVLTRFLTDKFPPKKINKLYGYRTKRSMKSQEAWDFAQSFSGVLLGNVGAILGIIGIILGFMKIEDTTTNIVIALIILVTCMAYPIYRTEKELKNRFDK